METVPAELWILVVELCGWTATARLGQLSRDARQNFRENVLRQLVDEFRECLDVLHRLDRRVCCRNQALGPLVRTAIRVFDDSARPRSDMFQYFLLLKSGGQSLDSFAEFCLFCAEFPHLTFGSGWRMFQLLSPCRDLASGTVRVERAAPLLYGIELLPPRLQEAAQIELNFVPLPDPCYELLRDVRAHDFAIQGLCPREFILKTTSAVAARHDLSFPELRELWTNTFRKGLLGVERWSWQAPEDELWRILVRALDKMLRVGLRRDELQAWPLRTYTPPILPKQLCTEIEQLRRIN